jgi:hypothetical protein
MRKLVLSVALVLLLCAGLRAEEPVNLFNGNDLDGWYTFLRGHGKNHDPNSVFTVSDGILRISGEDWGCITTEEEFDDYRLEVEFRWGEITHAPREDRARDSGVLLHSMGEDGAHGGVWMHSIEVQLIEGGTGDLLCVGDGSDAFALTCPVAPEKQDNSHVYAAGGEPVTIHEGRINWWGRDPAWQDVKDFRGAQDVEKPIGAWNHLDITTQDGAISVKLNGELVNAAIDCEPKRGRIQVQSEGAELFIRRMVLTPL